MLEAPIITAGAQEPDYLTADEIREQIVALTPSDHARIQLSAHYLSLRSGLPAADLKQDAFLRTLRGTRRCRRDRPFARTIAGTMRSVASSEIEAREGGLRPVVLPPELLDLTPDYRLSPALLVIAAADDRRLLARVTAALADDAGLLALVEALGDGCFGEVLQKRLGLTTNQLATARRRLKRRLADLAREFRQS